MDDTESKSHPVPEPILQDAKFVMELLSEHFSTPPEALFATIIAVAVLAKGARMPVQVLLDGVKAAYEDLDPLALDIGAEVKHGHH